MAKATSDYLWLGSAMEGLTCATLLLEYLHADVGVSIRSSTFGWETYMELEAYICKSSPSH